MTSTSNAGVGPAAEDEDDYMTMIFDDVPSNTAETSLQRRQRERREGERRGHVKSKAELAAEEAAAREKVLGTSLLADPAAAKKSKGFAMMAKMGFKGGGLGKKAATATADDAAGPGTADAAGRGRPEPIRVSIKEDRGGIGMESEKKRKLREAAEAVGEAAKRARADEGEYRDRVRREREEARLERQAAAAQKVAERMGDEKEAAVRGQSEAGKTTSSLSSRPLKAVNVLWRGLVRAREEAERDRRMRRDLEASLSRLPTYEDDDEDADDKRAMGKSNTVYVTSEDLDEEDPELDEFNALEPAEKLRRLVMHLREEHQYCFWCKFTYPDARMEGCPGVTEEDHD